MVVAEPRPAVGDYWRSFETLLVLDVAVLGK